MRKVLIVVGWIILGGVLSIPLYSLSTTVLWKRIDYFPFPVNQLLALKPFGKEFLVVTSTNEIYKISYPCLEGQQCWEKSDYIPSLIEGEYFDDESYGYIEYSIGEGECDTDHKITPLFGKKIAMCITSVAIAESFYIVSLVLTDTQELWIWDKPWVSPYTLMNNIFMSLCLGSSIGFSIGLLLVIRTKS
jgi:hypothetical protein